MPYFVGCRQIAYGIVVWVCIINCVTGADAPTTKAKAKKSPPGIQPKALSAFLKSKSEEAWEKGLSKVTQDSLDDEKIVELIIQFVNREAKSEYSSSLAQAIQLLGQAKQAQAAETLLPLFKAEDFRIAMISADAASATANKEMLDSIIALAERPEFKKHYGFRRMVVDAVSRYRDKTAIDFLVKRLGLSDGQLKYEIAMNLQNATGKEFGGKASDWKKWWTESRDQFEFGRTSTMPSVYLNQAPKAIPWEEPRPQFYGMTLYAKRVVFVIDRSGSMSAAVDGVTRLQRAQYQVQQAITALDETDSFNIVAFDHQMDVFSRRLVPATFENKAEGITFAMNLYPRGDTACYEPLKMALEASNELELIMFVSDGAPTSGAISNPAGIVIAISNLNLIQRTTIDSIGIDAQGIHEAFLKSLAGRNAGKLLMIR